MDIPQFRLNFPEFSDEVRYPSAQIEFQSVLATALVNPNRWGDLTGQAISLYVAHQLAVSSSAISSSSGGGSPVGALGLVASKSVGSVSVSYDNSTSAEPGAGFWNLSIYGKQYYRLMMIFGVGGIQL